MKRTSHRALAQTGEPARSRDLLEAIASDVSGAPVAQALHHFVRGDVDASLEWAARGLERHNIMLISNFLRPFERLLSASPAWPAVLAKANLRPVPAT